MSLIAESRQALAAAFAFGVVVNAAFSALLFFYTAQSRPPSPSLLRDGSKLVLALYLLSIALWASIGFVATLIGPGQPTGCQVAVAFTTGFDQLARFALLQCLLWAANAGAKSSTAATLIPQLLLVVRFVTGAVFVGLSRPDFAPVCISRTSVIPLGAVVLGLDGLIILLLATKTFSAIPDAGRGQGMDLGGSGAPLRKKALRVTVLGAALWTMASIPMILGIATISLALRTVLPAGSLALLILMIAAWKEHLVSPKARISILSPEAPAPRDYGAAAQIARASERRSRAIGLAVSDFPPSRYEEIKAGGGAGMSQGQGQDAGPLNITVAAVRIQDPGLILSRLSQFDPASPSKPTTASSAESRPAAISRSQTAPITPRSEGFMGGLAPPPRKWKSVRPPGGKLIISSPIIQDGDAGSSPLSKIPTVDLATAAKNDRDRRDMLKRASSLVVHRPGPAPPTAAATDGTAKRAASVKRTELGPRRLDEPAPLPTQPKPITDLPLQRIDSARSQLGTASSTATQLSPGVEEIRRRSPRYPPAATAQGQGQEQEREQQPDWRLTTWAQSTENPSVPSPKGSDSRASYSTAAVADIPPVPSPPRREPAPPARAANRTLSGVPNATPQADAAKIALSRIASVRTDIRPSRQKPDSPPPEVVEMAADTRTGLQRRGTTGLPSNPRAQTQTTKPRPQDPSTQQSQPTDGDGASRGQIFMTAASPGNGLKSSNSVVHRARPIPRKVEDPPETPSRDSADQSSSFHRRSKSGGSIISRKSLLPSYPGSPGQLPPLPPPPRSAGNPTTRPHPNNTKSMTFDEKMVMFYPSGVSMSEFTLVTSAAAAPTGPNPDVNGSFMPGRDSIPRVPAIPSAILRFAGPGAGRGSGTTSTDTSVRTASLIGSGSEMEATGSEGIIEPARNTSKFSVDTSPTIQAGRLRRPSSPTISGDIPIPTASGTAESRSRYSWGSTDSAVAGPGAAIIEHEPAAQPLSPDMVASRVKEENAAVAVRLSGMMTIMLDPSSMGNVGVRDGPGELGPDRETERKQGGSHWHRRVGDECPSFSGRKEKIMSRKMPPPAPLLLRQATQSRIAVVVPAPEPSPLDSPSQILGQIQEQLRRIQDLDEVGPSEDVTQKHTVLQDLEAEMGLQEHRWREMLNKMSRDSISSVKTASPRARSSTPRAGSNDGAGEDGTATSTSARRDGAEENKFDSTDVLGETLASRLSLIHEKDDRPELGAGRGSRYLHPSSPNVISIGASMGQLGSPTPPDTDESDDEATVETIPPIHAPLSIAGAASGTKLWAPVPHPVLSSTLASAPASAPRPGLWNGQATLTHAHNQQLSIPAAEVSSVRKQRRTGLAAPLSISSARLWQWRPSGSVWRGPEGLWRSPWEAAVSGMAKSKAGAPPGRPTTAQRPPRRSRRNTLLPDILESPRPLPDQNGTLGLFRFAWGERSSQATVVPVRLVGRGFAPMPGTMSSRGPVLAGLDARARQLELDEYSSSSFFDDYDDGNDYEDDDEDDEAEDDEAEDEGEDKGESGSGSDQAGLDQDVETSDDDFDETTLWEIASLLQTDQVPSANSLLPRPRDSDEYVSGADKFMSGEYSDEEEDEGEECADPPRAGIAGKTTNGLWDAASYANAQLRGEGLFTIDFGQPASHYRTTEAPTIAALAARPRRSPPRLEPAPAITSTGLWSADERAGRQGRRSWLTWSPHLEVRARLSTARGRGTTKSEWEAALCEAQLAGRRGPARQGSAGFDAARLHPVFAACSVLAPSTAGVYNAATMHPAAAVGGIGGGAPEGGPAARSAAITQPMIIGMTSAGALGQSTAAYSAATMHPAAVGTTPATFSAAATTHPASFGRISVGTVGQAPATYSAATMHPAALGNTVTSAWTTAVASGGKYDPAIRHPVFFAPLSSSLLSSSISSSVSPRSRDVHPAAVGYV